MREGEEVTLGLIESENSGLILTELYIINIIHE
jgi:hypothetical protein